MLNLNEKKLAYCCTRKKLLKKKLAIKEGRYEITAEIDDLEEKKKNCIAKEINKSKTIAHSRNIQMIFQDPISSLRAQE